MHAGGRGGTPARGHRPRCHRDGVPAPCFRFVARSARLRVALCLPDLSVCVFTDTVSGLLKGEK